MSRVANKPIPVPNGVDVTIAQDVVKVKGSKGNMELKLHADIEVFVEDDDGGEGSAGGKVVKIRRREGADGTTAMAGTTRALVSNLVEGVSQGFVKTLKLIGVGYRAQAQGNKLNLSLGFSHPVVYALPEGITAETPDNTTVLIKGIDKQRVGQAAAEIRAFRPPEPYKGKGVRYENEYVVRKETKKK